MAPPDPARLYEIAYDEGVRALAEQQAVIESLRNRIGLLLSAAAITTSFLGAEALGAGEIGLASWLATGSFAGVALVSLAILWPRRWEFAIDPGEVVSAYVEAAEPAPAAEMLRDLSLHMRRSCLKNEKGLNQLTAYFQFAVCLLTAEVMLWVLAIATGL